jgi:hypothetical protein
VIFFALLNNKLSDHSPSALQAPIRQFVRPKTKLQVPTAPTNSKRPPAHPPRRTSISALPIPAPTANLRITKKVKPEGVAVPAVVPVPARQTGGVFSAPAPTSSSCSALPSSTMALGGVQRPPVHAKVALPTAASARVPSRSNKQMVSHGSKVGVTGATGPRPSGLRAPTSRAGASGVAMRQASTAGGPIRPSITVGGRLGLSGVIRAVGPAGKGESATASGTGRTMRRV